MSISGCWEMYKELSPFKQRFLVGSFATSKLFNMYTFLDPKILLPGLVCIFVCLRVCVCMHAWLCFKIQDWAEMILQESSLSNFINQNSIENFMGKIRSIPWPPMEKRSFLDICKECFCFSQCPKRAPMVHLLDSPKTLGCYLFDLCLVSIVFAIK